MCQKKKKGQNKMAEMNLLASIHMLIVNGLKGLKNKLS